MEPSRSVVWLGLVLTVCGQSRGLLNSESQDVSYNFPSPGSPGKLPTLDTPPLDGIVRSLLNDPYDDLSHESDKSTSHPTRGNIRKSFALVTTTTTTTPKTTPHFEALSNNRDEAEIPRKKTFFINNEKVEVENSGELVEKFKNLKRNPGVRSTERYPYDRRTYEEKLEENSSFRTLLGSNQSPASLQPLPIRHWSTESNVIRDDELHGSSYPYTFVTPSPTTPRHRGSARYTMPTTERPLKPQYGPPGYDYEPPRSGKFMPGQLFKPIVDYRDVYIAPTTYRPPFNGPGSYSFSHRTEDYSRQESGDSRGAFRGSVKYMDTVGRDKQTAYVDTPQRGFVTSQVPIVSVAGRTGQRYIPPVTTPRLYTPNDVGYSYSYRMDDPIGSSTVSYGDYLGSTVSPLSVYHSPSAVSRPTPDGSYVFSYDAGDHERQEVRDRDGNVRGMYSFQGTDGERKLVRYAADAANGFVAQGNHIPLQQSRIPPGFSAGQAPQTGSYYFSYNAGDHARQEVRDDAGNVHGSFSYITPDGNTRAVNYQASPQSGFTVSEAHVPYAALKK